MTSTDKMTLCAVIIYDGQGEEEIKNSINSAAFADRIIIGYTGNTCKKELESHGLSGKYEIIDCRAKDSALHRGKVLKKLLAEVREDAVTFLRAGDSFTDESLKTLADTLKKTGAKVVFPTVTDNAADMKKPKRNAFTARLERYAVSDDKCKFTEVHLKNYWQCFPRMLYGAVIDAARAHEMDFNDKLMNADAEADFLIRAVRPERGFAYSRKAGFVNTHHYEEAPGKMREIFSRDWYFSFMEDDLFALFDSFNGKKVPRYMQAGALYMLWTRFRVNRNDNDRLVITGQDYDRFISDVKRLLSFIEDYILFDISKAFKLEKQMQVWLWQLKHDTNALPKLHIEEFTNEKGETDHMVKGDDFDFTRLSYFRVMISLIDYVDGKLEIDGSYPGYLEGVCRLTAWYAGKRIEIRPTQLWSNTRFFGKTYFSKNMFHISLPIEKEGKLRFKLEFNSRSVFVKLRFGGPQSRLSEKLGGGGYWRFGSYIATTRDSITSIQIVKRKAFTGIYHELRTWYGMMRKGGKRSKLAILVRMFYWLTRPFFFKRRIWLTNDKLYKGGDCGEYFYRYAKDNKDGIEVYYVVNRDSLAMKQLKAEGLKPVAWKSARHRLLFLNSEMIMATHAGVYSYNSFGGMMGVYFRGLFKMQTACIQHGLSIQGLEPYQNRVKDNTKLYFCASKYEIENLSSPSYDYPDKSVFHLTGIPRFDGLHDKHKKQILITPTWRHYLAMPPVMGSTRPYNPDFKKSAYFREMDKLLHDEKVLSAAREKGYTILYLLHPTFTAQLKDFDLAGIEDVVSVVPATGVNYEQLLTESALMVTDFSGVQYDFAYQKKPIIYFHHKDIPAHYSTDFFNYETMGFGEIARTSEQMRDGLTRYILNDCQIEPKYIERAQSFFAHMDFSNSARIYADTLKWANAHRAAVKAGKDS